MDTPIKLTTLMFSLCLGACAGPTDPSSTALEEETGSETGSNMGSEETGETTGEDAPAPDDESDLHAAVAEAMDLFPDYPTLHKDVITRTCTPDQGVCHNQKEYPDLHTPASMLASVGKPCNLNEDDPLQMFNGCESIGDRAILDLTPQVVPPVPEDPMNPAPEPEPLAPVLFEVEVAWVEFIVPEEPQEQDEPTPLEVGARVHLRQAIPAGMPSPEPQAVSFVRTTKSGPIAVGLLGQASWVAGSATLELGDLSTLNGAELTLLETGLILGDPNRDGVFGADEPYLMLDPGAPNSSYLLQRLQGTVPGSPMPLANQPLSSAEIVALACWIETLAAPGAANDPWLEINYDACGFARDFGGGTSSGGHSLSEEIQPILDHSCAYGGCHGGSVPAAGLDLSAGVARENLLQASLQNPAQQLVEPGNPTNSYLMTKLLGNGVSGEQMPKGGQALDDTSIGMIRQWIAEGAAND